MNHDEKRRPIPEQTAQGGQAASAPPDGSSRRKSMLASILACAVELRCGESGAHIHHVTRLMELLVPRVLEMTGTVWDEAELETVCMAASLHDIGKLLIPDELLTRTAPLTPEERAIVQRHTQLGATLLSELPFAKDERLLRYAADACRWHHERWDGGGYPDGLRGEQIPLAVRILSVADAYDTLVSARGGRPACPHAQAVEQILGGQCGAFDPTVLAAFREVADTFPPALAALPLYEQSCSTARGMADAISHYREPHGAHGSREPQEIFDPLTGLCDRRTFYQRLYRYVRARAPGESSLLCVNIRSFKLINDRYGAALGDGVLRHVAACIREYVDEVGGCCAHVASDEFALVLPTACVGSPAMEASYARAAEPPCLPQRIRICVGCYRINDPEEPASTMYDRAKIAANAIKGDYERHVAAYDDAMRSALLTEQHILDSMADALRDGEFEAWFQPQYNHASGAMIGAEALVRWNHSGTYVSPAEFVPVLEHSGLIYRLDQYVWERVCSLLRRWLDEGRAVLPVSVNVSRRDILHDDFVARLTGLVDRYGIPARLFRLEVTESAFADSTEQIVAKVTELIRRGYTVEIDDFGSGYSTLNSLKDLPASVLKLDMRFFEETENRQRADNIVASVVRMARQLGMAVIAEGVEDKAGADYLQSIGCHYIQGFYYARPMPAEEYERLLEECRTEPELTRLKAAPAQGGDALWTPKSADALRAALGRVLESGQAESCVLSPAAGGGTRRLRVTVEAVSDAVSGAGEDAKAD